MVRVWYEPPPGGPRSHLNRGAYGVTSAMEPLWVKKLARMNPVVVIVPALGLAGVLAYLPLSKYWKNNTGNQNGQNGSSLHVSCFLVPHSEPEGIATHS